MSRFAPSFDEGSGLEWLTEIPRAAGLEAFETEVAAMLRLMPRFSTTANEGEPSWLSGPLAAAAAWREEPRATVLLRVALILSEFDPDAAPEVARRAVDGIERGARAEGIRRFAELDRKLFRELRDRDLVGALIGAGLLAPRDCIDASAIKAMLLPPWGQYVSDQIDLDPRLPGFWMTQDPGAALEATLSLLDAEPDESVGTLGDALFDVLRVHDAPLREVLDAHGHRIAERLCARWATARSDTALASTAQHWSYVFLGGLPNAPPHAASPELTKTLDDLAKSALEALGRLRATVKGDGAREAFEREVEHLFLWSRYATWRQPGHAGWWGVLRRLLLLLRELPEAAVPKDLRTWDEVGAGFEPLPSPWRALPELMTSLCAEELTAVVHEEPSLSALRKKMGEFFLERLRVKKELPPDALLSNFDLVEPDPQWREGYILGLQELRVNPGKRGHHVLQHRAKDDPDDHVRASAALAAEQLRKGAWPKTGSPRALVLGALRRLREAHLLALGIEVDAGGARRTARLEVRRATTAGSN